MRADILRARHAELNRDLRENENSSEAQALQAALGEEPASRNLARLIGRRGEIMAQLAALDAAMQAATAEDQAVQATAEAKQRLESISRLTGLLKGRLKAAEALEADIKTLRHKIEGYMTLTGEIEALHLILNGSRPPERHLSVEASGGRIAEFMAALGFDAWLPLSRPEMRPPIQSLPTAEAAAQGAYNIASDERKGMRE